MNETFNVVAATKEIMWKQARSVAEQLTPNEFDLVLLNVEDVSTPLVEQYVGEFVVRPKMVRMIIDGPDVLQPRV